MSSKGLNKVRAVIAAHSGSHKGAQWQSGCRLRESGMYEAKPTFGDASSHPSTPNKDWEELKKATLGADYVFPRDTVVGRTKVVALAARQEKTRQRQDVDVIYECWRQRALIEHETGFRRRGSTARRALEQGDTDPDKVPVEWLRSCGWHKRVAKDRHGVSVRRHVYGADGFGVFKTYGRDGKVRLGNV